MITKSQLKKIPLVRTLGHLRWTFGAILIPVIIAWFRYGRAINCIRKAAVKRKLKVLFVVGNVSKWKAQSLYDLMLRSELFDPIVGLTICDCECGLCEPKKLEHIQFGVSFFEKRKMPSVVMYSKERHDAIDINDFNADIVFYHQPWGVAKNQEPVHAAKSALTYYIPYYVPNYGDVKFDCESPFHRTIYGFFTLSPKWSDLYESHLYLKPRACRFVPVGHTALDYFYLHEQANKRHLDRPVVIFAPHWSIDHPGNENAENYSTFLWSGRLILEYAKKHPQVQWVFKPHPTLRVTLERSGAWDHEEIASYYSTWADIATFCNDGDYYELFDRSSAMITDCGSFLMEYVCTGKPIIHLISSTCKVKPVDVSAKLFSTYYQVRNMIELNSMLDLIVHGGGDPNRAERMAMARESGLFDNYAAKNIMEYLEGLLK